MNKLTTFRGFIKDLKTIYENHQQIMDFGFGFVEDVTFKNEGDTTTQYPYLFVVPDNTSVGENQLQYSVKLIMMDRVVNYTDENLLDIMSDMNQILQDVISQFFLSFTAANGDYTYTYDIDLPVQLQPFADKFDDYVAGYFANITVTLAQGLDRCDAPFDSFVSVTPTPTHTTTPTPTPTPTITPTP
jgi:hypothetical protein